MEIGFRILIVFEILVSLSCIPDSKAQEPDSHKKKFLRFPEFGFPYRGLNLSSGFLGVTFFFRAPNAFFGFMVMVLFEGLDSEWGEIRDRKSGSGLSQNLRPYDGRD